MQQQQQQQHMDEIADQFQKTLTLDEQDVEHEYEEELDDDDDDDADFEFSFAGSELHSPVSAEEVFQNGQIRPIFQFSDDQAAGDSSEAATTSYGPSVRKVFVVSSSSNPENSDVAEGPYCDWSSEKTPENSSPAPEMRRKSNSTGLSKLWRVKDLLVRSHSDGKDAFVFLKTEEKAEETASSGATKDVAKKKKVINLAKIEVGSKTASSSEKKMKKKKSAYEVLYGNKEKTAGKSYLPYRQDLVGFFTNSNGMTRNVHPY